MSTPPPRDPPPPGGDGPGSDAGGHDGEPGPLGEDFDFDAEFAKAFGAASDTADAASTPPTPSEGESDADAEPTRDRDLGPVAEPAATGPAPRALVVVVLTPVASAPALAGVCAMAGLDVHVIETKRGALAASLIERDESSEDGGLAELLGEAPPAATAIVQTLSRTSRYGAMLLVSRLGDGDEGPVGTIDASQWNAGERSQEKVSAGLVLAQADDVVEQLLLGVVAPADVPGAIAPGSVKPWQARRLFRKTQRGKRP